MARPTHPRTGTHLVRFLLKNAAIGVGIAVLTVGLMVAFDFLNLRTLVSANDAGPLALCVMTVFFAITFGSVQMGIAVMLTADNGDRHEGRRACPEARLVPVRAVAARPSRHNGA
ncbi:hypothetical protein [Acuticoccus mangrovi]|uniref:Uncharacterized protein n=1 Tax=Acuticoccus mangrovi TaxID=2796142 RepID=A0A934MF71_9HYPH|nr:hypothetical protein [Acuticoccus mangrovi]MBJ3778347.1 hypothetical protein [Acuticoccus mangrovi]